MRVLKFGGSSVASATNISKVLDIVEGAAAGDRVILVSSAISGCTDALIATGAAAAAGDASYAAGIDELESRHKAIIRRLFTGDESREAAADCHACFESLRCLAGGIFARRGITRAEEEEIQTFGERFSTRIIVRKLRCEGYVAEWLDSLELVRLRGGKLDAGSSYARIRAAVSDERTGVFVAPGFIASDEQGRPVTLGRGGSDYSAAIYAAATAADVLQIWTDVPGIMTTNPKQVPLARTIPQISYRAALDLASNGAKVLYAPTIEPARTAGIAINIRNTFDPRNPGTVISDSSDSRLPVWQGVADMPSADGSESVISLVGENISDTSTALRRMDAAVAERGIKPLSPASCDAPGLLRMRVRGFVTRDALAAIHREFFEDAALTVVNVFVAGHGAVVKALLDILAANSERIAKRTGRSIRIAGIADSRRYVIDLQGIPPRCAGSRLENGCSEGDFVDAVCASAPRKSVFVDCTNSLDLYERYSSIFRAGLGIVSSNRRSLAVPYAEYASMKEEARQNGCFFRYDTTVGTALPILESISGEANCSDAVVSIEAVVSCTLNYMLSEYSGTGGGSFAALLKRAQDSGLTEADPRNDLDGRDALRKLLILAREAGVPLEESDVEVTPVIPKEFFSHSIEEFYSALAASERDFAETERRLAASGLKQRFVASIERDASHPLGYRAEIRIREIGPESPFYRINGTENVLVLRCENSAPLIIKGAGEGARQAAAGVLNDILKH